MSYAPLVYAPTEDTTVFNVTWAYDEEADVVVAKDGVTLDNGVDYTVTGGGSSITTTVPVVSGETLIITRLTNVSELDPSFNNATGIPASQLNTLVRRSYYAIEEEQVKLVGSPDGNYPDLQIRGASGGFEAITAPITAGLQLQSGGAGTPPTWTSPAPGTLIAECTPGNWPAADGDGYYSCYAAGVDMTQYSTMIFELYELDNLVDSSFGHRLRFVDKDGSTLDSRYYWSGAYTNNASGLQSVDASNGTFVLVQPTGGGPETVGNVIPGCLRGSAQVKAGFFGFDFVSTYLSGPSLLAYNSWNLNAGGYVADFGGFLAAGVAIGSSSNQPNTASMGCRVWGVT